MKGGSMIKKGILFVFMMLATILATLNCKNSKTLGDAGPSHGDRGIKIVSATYGDNILQGKETCNKSTVKLGNATTFVEDQCDGLMSCQYLVDVKKLKDPAKGCKKNFVISYTCDTDPAVYNINVQAEANNHTANIRCNFSNTLVLNIEKIYVSSLQYKLDNYFKDHTNVFICYYSGDDFPIDKGRKCHPVDTASAGPTVLDHLSAGTSYTAYVVVQRSSSSGPVFSNSIRFTTPGK